MKSSNNIIKSTYIKISLRLKNSSDIFMFKIFSIADVANLILGILFFMSTFILKNEMLINEKVIQFNLMTVMTIALFIVQKENFMSSDQEKNGMFLVAPISKKMMRKMNFLIDWFSTLKNVIIFQIGYIVFIIINYGFIPFIITFLSVIFITAFTYFFSELVKLLLMLLSKYISFIDKIKSYLLVLILTILYYVINHNITIITNLKYLFPNMISSLLTFGNGNIINYRMLLLVSLISIILVLVNYFIVSPIKIESNRKEQKKVSKIKVKKTYQESTIDSIINTLVINDEDTETAYLEQSLSIFTGLAWSMLILSLTGLFSNFYEIIIVTSIVTSFRCSGQILSFLFTKSPGSLNAFKIYPMYTDENISKKATLKVIKSKLFLVLIPLIILNIITGLSNIRMLIFINITIITVFFGGMFINYIYLKKHKPFIYTKNDESRPSELLPNLVSILLLLYLFIVLPISNFSLIPIVILGVVFLVPSILLIFVISKGTSNYGYPLVQQKHNNDSGISTLNMLAIYYQKKDGVVSDKSLDHDYSFYEIKEFGLQVELDLNVYKISNIESLIDNNVKPYIASITRRGKNQYIVIYETQEKYLIVGDPSKKKITLISIKKFNKIFNNSIIRLA